MRGLEFFEQYFKNAMNELKVCLICELVSIDDNSSCSLRPLHRYLVEGEYIELPVLVGVPMMQLGSKDFFIRIPLQPGDIVPVVVADYDIENLVLTGENRNPNIDDTHNINDAVALPVVLNPFSTTLPNNDPGDMVIQKRDATSKIVIKANSNEIVVEADTIRLGENATQGVKLSDDSTSTKVLAE